MKVILKYFLVLLVIGSIGCVNLREGAIDYRKASLPYNKTKIVFKNKYDKTKDNDHDKQIYKNDTISVHLQQTFIKDFSERLERAFSWAGVTVRGEIAIIVKVFELKGRNDFDFSEEGAKNGRLVFYSSDVRKGQYLNFSAMPIYGPITYDGNPLAIDFYIIELDPKQEQMKELLSILAGVGSTVYPPAAPILGLLDTLGGVFLGGDQNDTEFRYTMVLYPDKGYRGLKLASLEVGDYAFIREEDRNVTTEWSDLTFDANTGRVINSEGKDYRKNTYITVQINKGLDATNLDMQQNTFEKFLKKLDAEAAEDFAVYEGAVKKYLTVIKQTRTFNDGRNLLGNIKHESPGSNKRARHTSDILSKLKEAIVKEDDAKNNSAKKDAMTLTSEQIDYLLDEVKRLVKDPKLIPIVKRAGIGNTADYQKILNDISTGVITGGAAGENPG